MSTVHIDVKRQNTEFGWNIHNTFDVIPINVFQNQNRSQSKRVLNKTDVQDLADVVIARIYTAGHKSVIPNFLSYFFAEYRSCNSYNILFYSLNV